MDKREKRCRCGVKISESHTGLIGSEYASIGFINGKNMRPIIQNDSLKSETDGYTR